MYYWCPYEISNKKFKANAKEIYFLDAGLICVFSFMFKILFTLDIGAFLFYNLDILHLIIFHFIQFHKLDGDDIWSLTLKLELNENILLSSILCLS